MSLYLGIDAGTQSLKCLVIDTENSGIVAESSVNYGRDLSHYGAPNGFIPSSDPLVKQSDPMMWVEALELAFSRLKESGIPLGNVAGISGSGQQHGSVYLNSEFPLLVPEKTLAEQLRPLLSRPVSPIWMDRSTAAECHELDEHFGTRMRTETGSPAIERFTGPQIRKFAKENPEAYGKTFRIHLVSSFLCSVLCGSHAPIDFGDGAGMNLLNLKTLQWDPEIAEFTAPGLPEKLPPVRPSDTIAGGLAPFFEKFGFTHGIPVVVWSGDNPNSLVGIGASNPGILGISLGTSDTLFAPMRTFKTDPKGYGHVFGNPSGGFMSLICFTNGSLAREKIREQAGADRDFFDREALLQSVPGNHGKLMLPYFESESTPLVLNPRVMRNYSEDSPAEEIRAILESQALSLRLHSEWMGEKVSCIRLTGGASRSEGFRRILADVFQARIETISVTDSAGLGAAMRAANAVSGIPFETLSGMFSVAEESIAPAPSRARIYEKSLKDFEALENSFAAGSSSR